MSLSLKSESLPGHALRLDCIPVHYSLQCFVLSSPSRHELSDQAPEGPSVILLDGVAEFVDDDVVLDAACQFHHPGVKLQDVCSVAACPSALKMPDAGSRCS